MSEAAARERVLAVAETYIGTPFHDHGEVRGVGVDCATFLKCVFVEAGIIAPFAIGHYSPQFFLHQSEERYLGWMRKFGREVARAEAGPGDVVLYAIGKCFAHGALIDGPGWPSIIHAHYGSRRVRRGDGRNPHLGQVPYAVKFFSVFGSPDARVGQQGGGM